MILATFIKDLGANIIYQIHLEKWKGFFTFLNFTYIDSEFHVLVS